MPDFSITLNELVNQRPALVKWLIDGHCLCTPPDNLEGVFPPVFIFVPDETDGGVRGLTDVWLYAAYTQLLGFGAISNSSEKRNEYYLTDTGRKLLQLSPEALNQVDLIRQTRETQYAVARQAWQESIEKAEKDFKDSLLEILEN